MTDETRRAAALADCYLPDERLARFRERAVRYDRENAFFDEDLAELADCGYLRAFVPVERGGPGLGLREVVALQQRLATAAPSTALGVNMHLMCTGVARALAARGDDSLGFVFDETLAGEVYAFGISEPANDWVLTGSTTVATPRPDGGYLLTGVKIFTSGAPAWTRLIVHGLDSTDPENPCLVYGFVDRDAGGITVSDAWDVMGMRASHSRATLLADTPLRPDRVVAALPAGPVPHPLTFAISAHFQLLLGGIYAGIAQRALRLAADGLKSRRSLRHQTSYAELPGFRVRLADAYAATFPVQAQLDLYAREVDDGIDHGGGWAPRLISARLTASALARRATETALACVGGSGFSYGTELSMLHRDAIASLFHPPSADTARPVYAAALLDEP